MEEKYEIFLKLLASTLTLNGEGKDCAAFLENVDWSNYYLFCESQGLTGIGLKTIERFRWTAKPTIPNDLVFQWIGASEAIRHRNELLDKRCREIETLIEKEGKRCCILKGQGNAKMYPDPCMRTPGDIDVWLEGSKKMIVEYVHLRYPQMNVQYHHMNYPIFGDVDVEVHYYPSFCYNKWHNHKLQRYFKETSNKQFQHHILFGEDGSELCVPTLEFNLIFQLSHMMRHFFTQGIGLRHAVDYYYLLSQKISKEEKQKAVEVMKSCGMYKFLQAIMWIETSVLGLSHNTDIAPTNESAGKLVLREMLKGGNFGKYYGRGKQSTMQELVTEMKYNLRYLSEFPSEPLSRPFCLIWDYVKKRIVRY